MAELSPFRSRDVRPETVVVLGLGRFGRSVAEELQRLGHEVLGIDERADLVQAASRAMTYVVQGDVTDPEVLRQLGVAAVRHAVVAIGDDIESSVLATANLADLAVPDIWAKAVSDQHARILGRVGATTVVFPERDMGQRVAHRVTGHVLEYFQVDDDFVLVETPVPARYAGRTLEEAAVRSRDRVTVVAVKPEGGSFRHQQAGTTLAEGDVLLIAGRVDDVRSFTRSR